MGEINLLYTCIIDAFKERYRTRFKMAVLFGSQARHEALPNSDHDKFLSIDDLPHDPLARQRDVRSVLLPILTQLPGPISFVAKTTREIEYNLTPLLLDVFVDGIPLYGKTRFKTYQSKVLLALKQSGLRRQRIANTWMWVFPQIPLDSWELNWDGYHAGR